MEIKQKCILEQKEINGSFTVWNLAFFFWIIILQPWAVGIRNNLWWKFNNKKWHVFIFKKVDEYNLMWKGHMFPQQVQAIEFQHWRPPFLTCNLNCQFTGQYCMHPTWINFFSSLLNYVSWDIMKPSYHESASWVH